MNKIKTYGQYFTTRSILKEKIDQFIMNSPEIILEPSIGIGNLVSFICEKRKNVTFDMYEIDEDLVLLENIDRECVNYGNFLEKNIVRSYSTIISNPPYIRYKGGNVYIDFIRKCYNLLSRNGELVFITPSSFFKLSKAKKLLDLMMINGCFTHIFHPNDETLFDNACIDVMVWRYCKNKNIEKRIMINDVSHYIRNLDGYISFDKNFIDNGISIKTLFDIFVGFVSGKECVFKNSKYGNVDIITGENIIEKYIYIDKYPTNDKDLDNYLFSHKDILISRKIRKFNQNNWFEWGGSRNKIAILSNIGKECIYMYSITRRSHIAFIGKVGYFNSNLIILIPKQKCDLEKIVEYFNSENFISMFLFSGRFKIGQGHLCKSLLPRFMV